MMQSNLHSNHFNIHNNSYAALELLDRSEKRDSLKNVPISYVLILIPVAAEA